MVKVGDSFMIECKKVLCTGCIINKIIDSYESFGWRYCSDERVNLSEVNGKYNRFHTKEYNFSKRDFYCVYYLICFTRDTNMRNYSQIVSLENEFIRRGGYDE